jgi:mercuric ion transport protein
MHLAAVTIKDENLATDTRRGQTLMAAGGLFGALAASSCCILPVVLFSLGVSGAWIGNFTQLAPYQPYFLAATLVFLGTGYWLVHRTSKRACADGQACARPLPNRLVKAALVVVTIVVMIALGFDFLAPLFLNS